MAVSYVVEKIALGYSIEQSEVLPMLHRWRAEPMTYEQIAARLANHRPSVQASPQRLAELILEDMGTDRPPQRAPRKEQPA